MIEELRWYAKNLLHAALYFHVEDDAIDRFVAKIVEKHTEKDPGSGSILSNSLSGAKKVYVQQELFDRQKWHHDA